MRAHGNVRYCVFVTAISVIAVTGFSVDLEVSDPLSLLMP